MVRGVSAVVGPGARAARHARRARRPARVHPRHGLRRALSHADPPHRHGPPQGPQQRARRRRRRARQPLGHRRNRRRPHRDPPGSRRLRRLRAAAEPGRVARHGARARPGDPMLPRPSVDSRTPRVVSPSARRHDPIRRKPAEEVPGHRALRLPVRRLADTLGGPRRHRAILDRQGRADLPRRQSPHEALRLLGVAHRRHPSHRSRRALPLRGVHAAQADVSPREARLHAVLHLLHVADGKAGTRRLSRGGHDATGRRVFPAELLAQHARHPPRDAPAGWPADVHGAARARGPHRGQLGDVWPRDGTPRGDAPGGGQRGIPRLRKI